MIATILQSTASFNAVLYNERKVAQGKATLLEIKNFGAFDTLGYDSPEDLRRYLVDYSSRNSRIKKPQFHLAISCKGQEWTEEELLEFAHQYLEEMGYGDPDQPILIYVHHDTDNNHIHIVSSRVDPQGRKINDSKERIRSQIAIENILRRNIWKKAEKDLSEAMTYDFVSIRQFKAILEAMNYQCYESKDDGGCICVKKGGRVLAKIPVEDIKNKAEKNEIKRKPDPDERMKLRALLKKYRDLNIDRAGLEKELHEKFGLGIVWYGPKDNPYAYDIVDFRNKKVYDGNKILYIKDLLNFRSKEEIIKEIQNLIDSCLSENPLITTLELNKRLRKLGGYVKKDYFGIGNCKTPLDKTIAETLKRNNKVAFRQKFSPASEAEIRLICKLTGFEYPELLKIEAQPEGSYKKKEVGEIYSILSIKDPEERLMKFHSEGYRIIKNDDGIFIYNFDKNVILDMKKSGIPESMYSDLLNRKVIGALSNKAVAPAADQAKQGRRSGNNLLKSGMGVGSSTNREWEVGKKSPDRDDPDRNRGVTY